TATRSVTRRTTCAGWSPPSWATCRAAPAPGGRTCWRRAGTSRPAGTGGTDGEGERMTGVHPQRRTRPLHGLFGWWRALRPLLRGVLALVLVVALVALGVWGYREWRYCAADIARADGSCVGITDGSHGPVFGPGTAEALAL